MLPMALAATLVVGIAAGLVGGMGSDGRAIAGNPTASEVRPEPVVGDCLMGGPDGPFPYDDATGESYQAPYAGWLGTCDGVRYGEVTAVLADEADAVDSDGTLSRSLQDRCDAALSEYLGAPDASTVSASWWATYADGSTAVGPDPQQAAAGQDWAACIMQPPYWGPGGREGQVGADGYSTVGADSIRGGWDDIEVRNRLGGCYTSDSEGELATYCGDPHDAETLAWSTWSEGEVGSWIDELTSTCEIAAREIIGRSDATFGGRIAFTPVRIDETGTTVPVTAQTSLSINERVDCDARPADPDQVLTSTLAGLGDADVPLASR